MVEFNISSWYMFRSFTVHIFIILSMLYFSSLFLLSFQYIYNHLKPNICFTSIYPATCWRISPPKRPKIPVLGNSNLIKTGPWLAVTSRDWQNGESFQVASVWKTLENELPQWIQGRGGHWSDGRNGRQIFLRWQVMVLHILRRVCSFWNLVEKIWCFLREAFTWYPDFRPYKVLLTMIVYFAYDVCQSVICFTACHRHSIRQVRNFILIRNELNFCLYQFFWL